MIGAGVADDPVEEDLEAAPLRLVEHPLRVRVRPVARGHRVVVRDVVAGVAESGRRRGWSRLAAGAFGAGLRTGFGRSRRRTGRGTGSGRPRSRACRPAPERRASSSPRLAAPMPAASPRLRARGHPRSAALEPRRSPSWQPLPTADSTTSAVVVSITPGDRDLLLRLDVEPADRPQHSGGDRSGDPPPTCGPRANFVTEPATTYRTPRTWPTFASFDASGLARSVAAKSCSPSTVASWLLSMIRRLPASRSAYTSCGGDAVADVVLAPPVVDRAIVEIHDRDRRPLRRGPGLRAGAPGAGLWAKSDGTPTRARTSADVRTRHLPIGLAVPGLNHEDGRRCQLRRTPGGGPAETAWRAGLSRLPAGPGGPARPFRSSAPSRSRRRSRFARDGRRRLHSGPLRPAGTPAGRRTRRP